MNLVQMSSSLLSCYTLPVVPDLLPGSGWVGSGRVSIRNSARLWSQCDEVAELKCTYNMTGLTEVPSRLFTAS